MKIYSHILQGHEATKQNALDHAIGFDFGSCETEILRPNFQNLDFVDRANGIDIFYDIAADYYFFADSE